MSVSVKSNITVRSIHIEMERGPRTQRHHDMMMEFIERRIYTRTHVSGPAALPKSKGGPFRRSATRSMFILDIEEEYADEYLRRIRARITKAEQAAHDEREKPGKVTIGESF